MKINKNYQIGIVVGVVVWLYLKSNSPVIPFGKTLRGRVGIGTETPQN